MRIYLDGPFDLGAAFGVDDAPLLRRRDALLAAARSVFGDAVEALATRPEDPSPEADDIATRAYAVGTPFGAGLRLRVTAGPLLDLWRAAALHALDALRDSHEAEFGADGVERVRALLNDLEIRDVSLFLFGVGAGTVRLRTGRFKVAAPEDARALFKMLELGGYGDVSPGSAGAAANALLAEFRDKARRVLGAGQPYARLTERPLDKGEVEVRGFQGVIAIEEADGFSGREPALFRPGDEPVFLPYGPLTLGFGWLYIVVKEVRHFEVNLPRFLAVYMTARLAWDVSHRSERQFDALLKRRVAGALSGSAESPLSRADLSLLKSLAHFIISAISLQTQSVFSGDLGFFETYERYARIQERQRAIQASIAAFASAEEDEIFRIEARRAKRLGALVSILTVISLVGVAAEVLGSWSDGETLLGDRTLLLAALATPAVGGLLALLALTGFGARRG